MGSGDGVPSASPTRTGMASCCNDYIFSSKPLCRWSLLPVIITCPWEPVGLVCVCGGVLIMEWADSTTHLGNVLCVPGEPCAMCVGRSEGFYKRKAE